MDITLIRSFLEVAATGSFVAASERLFVTQSAVSLRIQRLEDSLGRPLFTRSKAGAELTQAGIEFERYAMSLLRVWEEARQQVAIPDGFTRRLFIGAQYSLWPRLGFRWIDALRTAMPDLNIRAELGMPDRMTRSLSEGSIQAALLYTPQLRPGLEARPITEEKLVLVAGFPDPTLDLADKYVFVDWGPEFLHAHAAALPHLTNTGLTFALGALSADFIKRRGLAAYQPARYVKRDLDAGTLWLVPDAPTFPFPVYAVWREDVEEDLRKQAETALDAVVSQLAGERDEVLDALDHLSLDHKSLGSTETE
ncbi:LysR family transcriptional regulator [Litoreibacter janthinus]|uniref:DNA-binding transcriptional regulator, LysR family n=1 Tax=Litoreibacter janthinus TaxID=670154 RepID=A0A1I6GKK1_9RHOB|nr:LysR family transcriptional regulator [Litoreibacter janthinus]SFR42724.1 DNA-binding transcriptional regulator, LysR family [Litoreibacter janthinus]